jgi:hypothetical protein
MSKRARAVVNPDGKWTHLNNRVRWLCDGAANWLVYKITEAGRKALEEAAS